MKTTQKNKIAVLFLFGLTLLKAQQNSLYNTYSLDPLQLNIAYAGASCAEANLHYRTQWLGVKDAPKMFQLNAHSTLGKSNGLGLRVSSQSYGILNLLGATAGYSYRVKLSETNKLHLGIGIGFSQSTLNGSKATVIDAGDVSLNNGDKQTANGFDSEFGAMFIGSKLKAGLAVLHLYNSNPSFAGNNSFKALPQINTQVSYVFNKDHKFEIEPWLLNRYTVYGNNVFEAMVNVKYNKVILCGVGYRSSYGLLVLLGAKIGNMRLGYSFDYGVNINATNLGSSHQIMLGFSICRTAKTSIPAEEPPISVNQPTILPTVIDDTTYNATDILPIPEEKISIEGIFTASDNIVLKNVKVNLLSDKGEIIDQTTTNKDGAFVFRKIPANKNFILEVVEADLTPGTSVNLGNLNGKKLKSVATNKNNEGIQFKILATDKAFLEDMKVEEPSLKMDLNGFIYNQDRKPLATTFKFKEESGAIVYAAVSDADGKFTLLNLDAEKNYNFEINQNDASLVGVTKIYLTDKKGKLIRVLDLSKDKASFKLLDADKISLGEFSVKEMLSLPASKAEPLKEAPIKEALPQTLIKESKAEVLVKMNKVAEDVIFQFNKTQLDADGLRKLDKVAALMLQSPNLKINIVGHTCNIGSKAVNELKSIRRATYVRIELINRGVNPKNINRSTGMGADIELYSNHSPESQQKNRTIRFENAD
jgi:type IX secretion system PorP/SprF family membrane protein